MELRIFQVDAFAEQVFQGNPAAVCPLENWLPDSLLQHIAAENNLAETAYFVRTAQGFHLRWFTPVAEVRLCGHATLASAYVLFNHLGENAAQLSFQTMAGVLQVRRNGSSLTMRFPADLPKPAEEPGFLSDALGVPILDVKTGMDDLLVRIESESALKAIKPDLSSIAKLGSRGLIVTAPGSTTDIASRCFFPNLGVNEDPVTGSAHTLLTPYWAAITGKQQLTATQGGTRTGYLQCTLDGDFVELTGNAQTYMVGSIFV